MKKLFVFICAIAACCSCTKESVKSSDSKAQSNLVINATFEDDSEITKTSLDGSNIIVWNAGDAISLLSVEEGTGSYCSKFDLSKGAETTNGSFTGTISKSDIGYYAVYPYNEATFIDKNGTPYAVWNGSEQIARKGNIPANAPMAAYVDAPSDDASGINLQFRNLTAYLKFTIAYKCKSVTVTSKNDQEFLSAAQILLSTDAEGNAKYIGNKSASNSVTLVGKDGEPILPGTYYIAVLPGTLANGFDMTFTSSNDENRTVVKSTDKKVTLTRNNVLNLGTIDLNDLMTFKGSGTSDDPYLISDCYDLQTLQILIDKGVSGYSTAYYKQINDIDFEGQTFTSIGTSSKFFMGSYDGGENIISNVVYKGKTLDSDTHVYALFAFIKNATVKNMRMYNVSLNEVSNSAINYISPLVGVALSENGSNEIINCHISDYDQETWSWSLESMDGVIYGGIVANNESFISISDCWTGVNLSFKPSYSFSKELCIGGIMGLAQGEKYSFEDSSLDNSSTVTITRCRNVGSIYVDVASISCDVGLGGILGKAVDYLNDDDVTCSISICVNNGELSLMNTGYVNSQAEGGIVGWMDSDGSYSTSPSDPSIVCCLNKGILNKKALSTDFTKPYRSGILGNSGGYSAISINYCVNTQYADFAISNDGPTTKGCYVTVKGCPDHSDCTVDEDLDAGSMQNLYDPDATVLVWTTNDDETLDLYIY